MQKFLTKLAVAAAFALCLGQAAVADEYVIARGDVLEFQVLGIPDLRQRAAIGPDGTVLLPLVGSVDAAGRTVSALRDAVESEATQKGYPVRGGGGGDVWHFVHPEAIVLQVVEYRPIYLNGDVTRPGEQPYRAGMTVRQALAVAGGYDLARFRLENPILALTDLKTQHSTMAIRLAAAQTRADRLTAELEDLEAVSFNGVAEAVLPMGLLPEFKRLETDLFATRIDVHDKEKQAIRVALSNTNRRIGLLDERNQNEKIAIEEDTIELERVKKLYEQGLTQITRVNEARRALLLWSTQNLETFTWATQLERERDDLERNLVRTEDTRQIELLRDLQVAKLEIADLQSQLQGNAEKLVYVGALRSELARGMGQEQPDITIVRRTADGVEQIHADEDTDLWPGDVVEVALNIDWLFSPNLRSSDATE